MGQQVEQTVKECAVCQNAGKSAKISPAPLQPVVRPFEQSPPDCRYLISLVDYLTKWPEVACTASATSTTIITFLSSVFLEKGSRTNLLQTMVRNLSRANLRNFLVLVESNIPVRPYTILRPMVWSNSSTEF